MFRGPVGMFSLPGFFATWDGAASDFLEPLKGGSLPLPLPVKRDACPRLHPVKHSGLWLPLGCGTARGCPQPVEVVRPCLHHGAAFVHVLSVIVCRPDGIFFTVGKLCFDDIRPEALFIEKR